MAAAAVAALFALPLFEGRAIDRVQAYGSVPAAWKAAVADVERTTPADRRVMLLPGELFGFYRWGNTVSSIGPAISKRPLLIREVVPYADARAADLQVSVDDLVQQGRLVPGQLEPLLRLMGVGQVLVDTSALPIQSGALDPVGVAQALSGQAGFRRPAASYGALRAYAPASGRSGPSLRLPDLRRYPVPGGEAPGIVRLHPLGGATVLDGDAQGIGELAADGALDPGRALFYAGDLDRSSLRSLSSAGATLVFTDSNRRRVMESNLLRANQGPTVGSGDPIPRDWPRFDLFGSGGSRAETVAEYTGLRYLRSPLQRGFAIFPEHRPYAALDGRLDTAWLPARYLPPSQRYMELALARPRAIGAIRIFPETDRDGATDAVAISVNGGRERTVPVHPGWNPIPIRDRVSTLRLRVAHVTGDGSGGIDELVLPGVSVRESLRLPADLSSTASGLDLSHDGVTILLQRTTADFPYRQPARGGRASGRGLPRHDRCRAGDRAGAHAPVSRTYSISGWAGVNPSAPDAALDRLTGVPRGWTFESSSRFEGVPAGARRRRSTGSRQPLGWRPPARPGSRCARLAASQHAGSGSCRGPPPTGSRRGSECRRGPDSRERFRSGPAAWWTWAVGSPPATSA